MFDRALSSEAFRVSVTDEDCQYGEIAEIEELGGPVSGTSVVKAHE